jgi:SNF2 domain-containing protein
MDDRSNIALASRRVSSSASVTYEPKLAPRDYQTDALAKMSGRVGFALLMAMRTGKTKTLLDDFGRLELAGEVSDLLVVAPKGVYRTWESEIEKHLSFDLLSRLRVARWQSGKTVPPEFLDDNSTPRIFLVNVEAISAGVRARAAIDRFLLDGPNRAMVAIDESTIIKNQKAKRTKYAINSLRPRSKVRRILSGLPTPRSPLDIYHQFAFLDPVAALGIPGLLGYGHWWEFRQRHAILRRFIIAGRAIDLIVGYRDVEEIQRRIEPHSYRVEFRPNIPSTYSIREVALTEEQTRIYRELKEFATARLTEEGENVTATMVMTQILRMHQVLCGHVPNEEGEVREIAENKTDELLELLADYKGKAVIWASYDNDIWKIAEALAKEYDESLILGYDEEGSPKRSGKPPLFPNRYVARFWGGNDSTREEEERRFKTDPDCRFMVATPAAGGWGRTWDIADLVVYYSSTNNLEHREQSEQRVQGVGKEKQVDYVDLIAPGTIEKKILDALRKKMDLAATITGDEWREWIV